MNYNFMASKTQKLSQSSAPVWKQNWNFKFKHFKCGVKYSILNKRNFWTTTAQRLFVPHFGQNQSIVHKIIITQSQEKTQLPKTLKAKLYFFPKYSSQARPLSQRMTEGGIVSLIRMQ